MVDYPDAGGVDPQQRNDLALGKCRNGNNGVRPCRRIPGLGGEARAKLGSGVLAGHHEQVVKGDYRAA